MAGISMQSAIWSQLLRAGKTKRFLLESWTKLCSAEYFRILKTLFVSNKSRLQEINYIRIRDLIFRNIGIYFCWIKTFIGKKLVFHQINFTVPFILRNGFNAA